MRLRQKNNLVSNRLISNEIDKSEQGGQANGKEQS